MIIRKAMLLLLLIILVAATTQTHAQPTVDSITVNGINPTNANSLGWNVNFSEPVSGVTAANFTLAPVGVTGAINTVTPLLGNQTWAVTAAAVAGDGTLGVDLTNPSGISGTTAPLAQTFIGDLYIIDNTAPFVVSITRLESSPTSASVINFAVTFSEPIFNLTSANFSPSGTPLGGTVDNSVAPSADQSIWTASVSGISGSGFVGLDLTDTSNVTDAAGNFLFSDFTAGEQYQIDQQGPQLVCITRLDASPTSATSVSFMVEFDEPAANLQVSNFTINVTGTSGTISSVSPSGSGTTWTVTVNGVSGAGLLTVDLTDAAGITDQQLNPAGSGVIRPGCESYIIDRINPEILSIALPDDNPTSGSDVTFVVTFNEPVTSATLADFSLFTQGTTATISGVITAGDTTTVTVSGITGPGLLCLQVNSPSSITDLLGNSLTGVPYTSACYIICSEFAPLTGFDPADGSTTESTVAFLRWTAPVSGLTFQVYFDGIFSGRTTDTSFAIPGPLAPGQHTYLIDVDGSCTSGSLITFNVLNSPTLVSPQDDFVSCIAPRRFRWNPVAGATTYTLYIDGLVAGETTSNTTVLQPANPPIALGPHTWYIVASNPFGQQQSVTYTYTITVDDTIQPVLIRTNGTVYDILTVNNNIYIAGDFDSVLDGDGEWKPRSNIAMFAGAPLQLTNWAPTVNGIVYTLENAGPSLLLGGDFTRIGTELIARIASFDFETTSPSFAPSISFRPGANDTVRAIEAVGSTIYYGGDFTKINSQVYNFANPGKPSTRLAIASLNTTGTSAVSLAPNASVRDLLYDGENLYVAGLFSSIGGEPYRGLVQLDRVAGSQLAISNDFISPSAQLPTDLYVYTMMKSGNTLYLGGSFNQMLGSDRRNAAAINLGDLTTSASITAWDPRPNSAVHALSRVSAGRGLYIGGTFTSLNNTQKSYLVGVDPIEGLPFTCSFDADRAVYAIEVPSNQIPYVGGQVTVTGALPPSGP